MGAITNIAWTDYTWSPWLGCRKVSPGCQNCYITSTTPFRTRHIEHGARREPLSEAYWKQPRRWNDEPLIVDASRPQHGRARVFPSLCDPFDDEAPLDWFVRFYCLVMTTPNLNWLLLTKRPENIQRRMQDFAQKRLNADWVGPFPDNVWLGTSVENQKRADERIPILLSIPARVRFLSVEPLLERVDLDLVEGFNPDHSRAKPMLDWVIVGGESGKNARPCNVDWIRSVVRQCKAAAVPCFVKQLGSNVVMYDSCGDCDPCIGGRPDQCAVGRVTVSCGKLKHPKGGDPSEWPADLQVREFPTL